MAYASYFKRLCDTADLETACFSFLKNICLKFIFLPKQLSNKFGTISVNIMDLIGFLPLMPCCVAVNMIIFIGLLE